MMNNTLTIEKLFEGRLFRVPDYQRGYAWERKQLEDFLEDLDLLLPGRHHYTGTIVIDRIHKPPQGASPQPTVWDHEGRSFEEFDVVDGQQRLTTIVLLLDAVRREMDDLTEYQSRALGLRRTYVWTETTAGERLPKLKLNADTHGFWVASVLADHPGPGAPANAAQNRLAAARQRFAEYLAGERIGRGVGYADWLEGLRTKVTSQLIVVPYEVTTSAEVGVIFEVMNDRGKELTELEKAKNYFLYLSTKLEGQPNLLGTTVNVTWSAILTRLMAAEVSDAEDEDQLLRAHWLMGYDPDRRRWSRTASLKKRFGLRAYVGRHDELLGDASRYIELLGDAAVAYTEIYSPRMPKAFALLASSEPERLKVVAASRRLLRVGTVATFLPLLIAARLRYPRDPAFYLQLLDLCEKYAFRVYRLLKKYSNSGQSQLFRLAHEVFAGARDQADAINRFRELVAYYSPEVELADAINRRPTYGWSGLKYLLYEWEHHLAGKRAVLLDWEVLEQRDPGKSIEHILPQTPTDPYWQARFNDAEVERLTHDVGNLVLTEDNQSYFNKGFDRKAGRTGEMEAGGSLATSYANSSLFQERVLVEVPEWTPAAVEKRGEEIREWMLRRWHVEPPKSTEGVSAEDDAADEEVAEELLASGNP